MAAKYSPQSLSGIPGSFFSCPYSTDAKNPLLFGEGSFCQNASQARRTFSISMARVMGPIPPGTGVM